VVASLLLVTALDLLDAAVRPAGEPNTLHSALVAQGPHTDELVLTLDIGADSFEAQYELRLHRADALYEHIRRGDAERDVRGLVELLGGVTVDGHAMLFDAASWSGSGPQDMSVGIASASYPLSRRPVQVDVYPPSLSSAATGPSYGDYCCLPPLSVVVTKESAARTSVVAVDDSNHTSPIVAPWRANNVAVPMAFNLQPSAAAGRADSATSPGSMPLATAGGMVGWESLLDKQRLLQRFNLTVDAGRSIDVRFDVQIARDTPLFKQLQQGGALRDLRGLVEVLGGMQVGGRPVPFEVPDIEVPKRRTEATVSLRSRPVEVRESRTPILVPFSWATGCCAVDRRVIIATDDVQVTSGNTPPTEQSRSRTVYDHVEGDLAFDLLSQSPTSSTETKTQAPADDAAPMADWRSSSRVAGGLTLQLTIKNQEVTARYELALPPASPLREALEPGTQGLTDELIELLGPVTVDDEALSFREPSVRVEQGRLDFIVSYESDPKSLVREDPRIRILVPESPTSLRACCVPTEQLVIESDREDIVGIYGPADVVQRSPTRAVYRQVNGQVVVDLLQRGFDQDRAKPKQVDSLVRSLNNVHIPGLSPLLYWLAISLPLLIFLAWYRRGRLGTSPGLERTVQVVSILVGFYVVVSTVSVLADLTDTWSLAPQVVRQLKIMDRWPSGNPLNATGPALILVGMGLVWPALVSRWETNAAIWEPNGTGATPTSRWSAVRRGGVLLVLVVGAVGALVLLADRVDTQLAEFGGPNLEVRPWVAGCAVASAALLYWGLAALRIRPRVPFILLSACVLVAIPLAEHAADPSDNRLSDIVRVTAVTAAGLALIAALVRVVCAAIPESPGPTAVPLDRGSMPRAIRDTLVRSPVGRRGRGRRMALRLLFAAVALFLVVPVARWSGQPFLVVDGWTLMSLVDWLGYVVYACVGYLMLRRLRELDGWQVEVHSRWMAKAFGLLLLLPFTFDPGQRILYLPLPLLVGYILFQFWLLPQRPAQQLAHAEALWRQWYPRPALVTFAVDASHERRALRAQRKELAAKVGTGDITRDEYREILGEEAQTATLAGQPIDEFAMSYGPTESSWTNGLLFAGYSLALSLPWIAVYYLHHELTAVLQDREFLPLALTTLILSNVLQWPLLGFFFGYFYPAIRGRNGLWKGLSLAIAGIVPWLALNLAYGAIGDNDNWGEFVTWAAQVFVTSVLTGFLAGDLENLRRAGYGWSALLDIHNFSALAAFGTSVLVASGGALVTLLTSTVGEIVVQQFTSGGGGKPPGGGP
jgi:hypothetical protein